LFFVTNSVYIAYYQLVSTDFLFSCGISVQGVVGGCVRRRIGRLRSLRRFGFSGYPVSGIEPGSQVDKFAPLGAKREEFTLSG
jgi:hypothetical protein